MGRSSSSSSRRWLAARPTGQIVAALVPLVAAAAALFASSQLPSVDATSNGAGSCMATNDDLENFKQAHGEAQYPGQTGDYSIQFSAAKFVAGCMYTISLCGPSFNGFLLNARDMYSDVAMGHFSDPSTAVAGTKLMSCSGSADNGVTHTLATSKSSMHFKWRAPISNAADTHFYVTVVRSSINDWYRISKMFDIDESSTACPSVPDTNQCPSEGASSGTAVEHDMSSMVMEMQMQMKFSTKWAGINVVFPNWVLTTKTAYVATLLFIGILCFLAEWGQSMSVRLDRYFNDLNSNAAAAKSKTTLLTMVSSSPPSAIGQSPGESTTVNVDSSLTVGRSSSLENSAAKGYSTRQHALRTLVKLVLQFIALFLMIVFMILDVGLCCAMMAGYGVGFYLFGRDRSASQDCH